MPATSFAPFTTPEIPSQLKKARPNSERAGFTMALIVTPGRYYPGFSI